MGHALAYPSHGRRAGAALAAFTLGVAPVMLMLALDSAAKDHTAQGRATARANQLHTGVGPGPVQQLVNAHGYQIELRITPNRATSFGTFTVELRKKGRPINGARIHLTTMMTTMNMGFTGPLLPKGAGHYLHSWPPLEMSGRWRFQYEIRPPGRNGFTVTLIDQVA
jgi:hypothetical protein